MVRTFRDSSVSCSSNVRLFTSWLPNKKKGLLYFSFFFGWGGGQLVNYATSSKFHGKKQHKKCYLLQIAINEVVKIEIRDISHWQAGHLPVCDSAAYCYLKHKITLRG